MKTMKDWALAYNELGWPVIPVSADKVPLAKWKKYQTEEQPPEVVEEWWTTWPTAGIGIITGAASGICVVDCDNEMAASYVESIGMTSLIMQETRKGVHYFFEHPGEHVKTQTRFNDIDGLDIRGDGGYVKVFPSTGYEWSLPIGVKVSDIPHEIPTLELGKFEQQAGGDPLDLTNVKSMYEMPDLLGSGERNDGMTRVVGKLIKENPSMWGLELAHAAWRKNLEVCKPPLAEDEIKQIVVSVMSTHQDNNPDEFNEDGDRKMAVMSDMDKRVYENMRMLFEYDSIGLCGEPPEREWLVEGIIPAGLPGVLASPGGVGKTYMLMDLALKIACPRPNEQATFFGKPVRKHGKVVMFLAEDDSLELMRRFEHLDPHYSRVFYPEQLVVIPIPELEKAINFGTKQFDSPKFTDEAHAWFETLTQLDDLAMVVFDPLQSFFDWRFDEDNVAADRALKWAQSIAVKTGAAVIYTHHLRKEDVNQTVLTPQAAISKVRGASNVVNSARFAIPIWRPSEDVHEEVCNRLGIEGNNMVFMAGLGKENFGGDVSTHWLVRDAETGLLIDRTDEIGGSSVELPVKVAAAAQVEEWLSNSKHWFTRQDIVDGTSLSKTAVYRAVKDLMESNAVIEHKKKLMLAKNHEDFSETCTRIGDMLTSSDKRETIEGVVSNGLQLREISRAMRSESAQLLFRAAVKYLVDDGVADIVRFSVGKTGQITVFLQPKTNVTA